MNEKLSLFSMELDRFGTYFQSLD